MYVHVRFDETWQTFRRVHEVGREHALRLISDAHLLHDFVPAWQDVSERYPERERLRSFVAVVDDGTVLAL